VSTREKRKMANKYDGLIKAHVRSLMPEGIRLLARGVEYVMWNGLKPDDYMQADQGFTNWTGHEPALRAIEAWAAEAFPAVLYVDMQTEDVREDLPDVWADEDGVEHEYRHEDFVRFERHEIALAVFGDVVRFGELRFPGSLVF
jgi:hypothetical protein